MPPVQFASNVVVMLWIFSHQLRACEYKFMFIQTRRTNTWCGYHLRPDKFISVITKWAWTSDTFTAVHCGRTFLMQFERDGEMRCIPRPCGNECEEWRPGRTQFLSDTSLTSNSNSYSYSKICSSGCKFFPLDVSQTQVTCQERTSCGKMEVMDARTELDSE